MLDAYQRRPGRDDAAALHRDDGRDPEEQPTRSSSTTGCRALRALPEPAAISRGGRPPARAAAAAGRRRRAHRQPRPQRGRRDEPRSIIAAIVARSSLLFVAACSLFIVDQTEQALVPQFGEPRRVIREPGPERRSCPSSRTSSATTAGCSTSSAPPRRSSSPTRSGSSSTPSPATASPTRCSSIRRSARPRRHPRCGSARSSPPACGACSATSRCWRSCPPSAPGSWAQIRRAR